MRVCGSRVVPGMQRKKRIVLFLDPDPTRPRPIPHLSNGTVRGRMCSGGAPLLGPTRWKKGPATASVPLNGAPTEGACKEAGLDPDRNVVLVK